jgi:hypothetical protein
MAYDEDLANRIREALAAEQGVTEKRMFGGLAFLIGGHMAVSASGRGGLMVRCDPEETETHLQQGAERMVMRGREMDGWLRVHTDDIDPWVRVGVGYARSLPPKG